jgi:hypothetical protein
MADLRKEIGSVAEEVKHLDIGDDDAYVLAADYLKQFKGLKKKAEDFCKPRIEEAHLLHKAAIDTMKKLLAPLADAEARLKAAMANFAAEKRRKAEEEQIRLQREAIRQAQ